MYPKLLPYAFEAANLCRQEHSWRGRAASSTRADRCGACCQRRSHDGAPSGWPSCWLKGLGSPKTLPGRAGCLQRRRPLHHTPESSLGGQRASGLGLGLGQPSSPGLGKPPPGLEPGRHPLRCGHLRSSCSGSTRSSCSRLGPTAPRWRGSLPSTRCCIPRALGSRTSSASMLKVALLGQAVGTPCAASGGSGVALCNPEERPRRDERLGHGHLP